MEIDKSLHMAAPPERIWAILLDPQAMAACVPGMQSVEIISPDEYAASMHVKIAFVSARFKLRTRIVERREPVYLKAEGTGEDASVASSLKQVTELSLSQREDGTTDLRIKVHVDLLGRMGSFGLSVMKTKADRLWDEFGINLAARLAGGDAASEVKEGAVSAAGSPDSQLTVARQIETTQSAAGGTPGSAVSQGWWQSLLRAIGIQPAIPAPATGMIVVEVQRPDQTRIRVEWPATKSEECAQWLRDAMR